MGKQQTNLDVQASKWGNVEIAENTQSGRGGRTEFAFFISLAEVNSFGYQIVAMCQSLIRTIISSDLLRAGSYFRTQQECLDMLILMSRCTTSSGSMMVLKYLRPQNGTSILRSSERKNPMNPKERPHNSKRMPQPEWYESVPFGIINRPLITHDGVQYIENQAEIRVRDVDAARKLIDEARRTVNATNVNEESSRSHLLCGLKVVRIPISQEGIVMVRQ